MGLVAIILALIVIFVASLVALILLQLWRHNTYFSDRGVTYLAKYSLQSLLFFFGGKVNLIEAEKTFYSMAKSKGKKFVGYSDFFTAPAYLILDLDLLRHIYVKDFENFVNRRQFASPESDILFSRMLTNMTDGHWKGMRGKLSPTFTTGKIKRLFGMFDNSSQRMCNYVRKHSESNGDFNIYDCFSKFSMDVIASCAFGVDSKTFELNPGVSSEFEQMGQRLQFSLKISAIIKFVFFMAFPTLAKKFGISPIDTGAQHYFHRVVTQVLKQRRESGDRQNDFLQLMMDVQDGLLKDDMSSKEAMEVLTGGGDGGNFMAESSSAKLQFEDDDVVANCTLFFAAGFDTTRSFMAMCAYQLALEQGVQEKLYQEINKHVEANNGKFTYEALLEMEYMDLFITETLRFLPPATRTERKCTKDYQIPGTNVVIEKGTTILLPIFGIHHDPSIYEDPEKFDPERFLPEQKSKRHPYAFSPFGHGPRNCIGMRFALTEVKAVIAQLVYNFKFEPCSRTDIPMKLSPSALLTPADGLWLNFTPRKEE